MIPFDFKKSQAAYEFSGKKQKINHLLFMDALKLYSRNEKILNWLVPTIRGFNDDIGMEFSKEKCAMLLVIEKGNIVKSVVNSVGKVVRWKLAKKGNIETGNEWYENDPESILENEDYKSCEISVFRLTILSKLIPDLIVVDKKSKTSKIIDFAVPGEVGLRRRRKEK